MKSWPVHDAKARFSELLEACLNDGPQMVTRRGTETAVIVPIDEWKRMNSVARPSLKSLLLAEEPRVELPVAPRGKAQRRLPPTF